MGKIDIIITVLSIGCALFGSAKGFEENSRFCIHTEPQEHHVSSKSGAGTCEIPATILTPSEQKTLLVSLCENLNDTNDYRYLKLRNGELNGRGSYQDICTNQTNPLLAWIPYNVIQLNYASELNPKEQLLYIAKATNVNNKQLDICHFRQLDLVSNISGNLSTCTAMTFKKNFYALDHKIDVLVELQPLMYEIRNITYKPSVNSTASYKTMLGKGTLKNLNHERKLIYGSVKYSFVEQVKLNISTIHENQLEKLPILFERHPWTVVELDSNGIGGVLFNELAYFGRIMDPKSSVKVDVIGQWAELDKHFTGELHEYFGNGVKRFKNEVENVTVSFIRIDNTEPVYESPETTHLFHATPYITETKEQQQKKPNAALVVANAEPNSLKVEVETEDLPRKEGRPYPGFLPWAIAGGCVLAIAMLAAGIYMIRECIAEGKIHKYHVTKG